MPKSHKERANGRQECILQINLPHTPTPFPGACTLFTEKECLQAAFGDKPLRELQQKRDREKEAAAAQPQGDPNLIPLGVRVPTEVKEPEEPIPEVEWWDALLLQNKVYEINDEGEISNLREDKITIYVEHPVPLEPPAEEVQPPPMPLPLTQKVQAPPLHCSITSRQLSCHQIIALCI